MEMLGNEYDLEAQAQFISSDIISSDIISALCLGSGVGVPLCVAAD